MGLDVVLELWSSVAIGYWCTWEGQHIKKRCSEYSTQKKVLAETNWEAMSELLCYYVNFVMIVKRKFIVKHIKKRNYLNDNILRTLGATGMSMNREVAKKEMRCRASKLVGISIAFSLVVSNK